MNGIKDKYEWIKSQISKWVTNVTDYFKKLLGISSPSKLFMTYGNYMAEGLAIGWRNGMDEVRSAMQMPVVNGNFSADASPYGIGGSVINIYPQQLDSGTMDYIFARVNSRMGAAI